MKLCSMLQTTPKTFLAHWWCYFIRVYGSYWENTAGLEQKSVWLSGLSIEMGGKRCLGKRRRTKASELWLVACTVKFFLLFCTLASTNYMRLLPKTKIHPPKREKIQLHLELVYEINLLIRPSCACMHSWY